jgi:tetratricopeptide (TPR) repeat protein
MRRLLGSVALAVVLACAQVDHNQAGRTLLTQKNWKAALAEFQQAPASTDTHIGAGIALWGIGDHQGALTEFQRATESNPKSAEAHFDIGIAYRDFGENERAAAELRLALKLKPGYDQAEIMLGLLLQQGGQPDKAIAQYRALLKRNPRSAEAHNWLGVALLQKNEFAAAEAEFREAIKLKPDYARAYNNLGSTLAQAGEIVPAVEILERGLKHAPDDLQLHLNLAMALRSKGDAEAALAEFRGLVAGHADSSELHYQYGQTLRQKGNLAGAVDAFAKSLELNPESQEAYYGLGQALKESAARLKPPNGSAALAEQLQAGNQALERGDIAHAREAGTRAVAGAPESPEAHNLFGFALWYSGDRARAAAELDESLRLNPAAGNVYSFRGMTYRESGDLDRDARDAAARHRTDSARAAAVFRSWSRVSAAGPGRLGGWPIRDGPQPAGSAEGSSRFGRSYRRTEKGNRERAGECASLLGSGASARRFRRRRSAGDRRAGKLYPSSPGRCGDAQLPRPGLRADRRR